jgi:hypothetical protein
MPELPASGDLGLSTTSCVATELLPASHAPALQQDRIDLERTTMRIIRTAAGLAVAATLTGLTAIAPVAGASSSHTTARHVKLAELKDPLATNGDQFGHDVATDAAGNETLVSAYESVSGAGRAYLYKSSHGKWATVPEATFTDPVAGTFHYGYNVALSPNGTTAYVSADQQTDGARTGAGAVFVYRSSNGVWPKHTTSTISDPGTGTNDFFGVGISVSSDGGTLVIGAPGTTLHRTSQVGATYVYTASHGKLPSTPSATLDSPDPVRGFFGYSVSVSDNSRGKGVLAIGAYVTSVGAVTSEGAAYLYDAKGLHSWALAKGGSLKDPGALNDDLFGGVVTIDAAGTVAMVGAQDETEKGTGDAGAVFTYVLKSGTWKHEQTLDGPANAAANFASPSISANGKVAVMGAANERVDSNNYAGEAFVYVATGTTYALGASIPDPTGGSPVGQEYFGAPSALSSTGDLSVIAAPATTGSDGNPGPGVVYIYNTTPS